nr:hypothetical protein [Tanacetum cinerariifolium]
MNGKKPLTLDFKTFCTSTGLDYNNGKYVAHPSSEAVKVELAKIVTNASYLDRTLVRKVDTFVIQGPKASGALSKKRNKPKPKNTTLETQATPPNVPTEDYEKTHSVSSGQTAHPQDTEENIQFVVKGFYSPLDEGTCSSKPLPKGKPTDAKDLEGNIQPAGMGLPSTSLDEGIRTSQLLPEGKTTDPTDSGGNIQPVDKGLPSTVPNEGIGKTKLLSEGPHGDKDSEGFKPPADMEPSTTLVTDPQTLLRATVADVQVLLLSDDELIEESEDKVFKAGHEMDEEIYPNDEKEIYFSGYYEENVDHKDQTNKLVNETMKIIDNIRKARIYERAKLLKALQVSKTLEAESTLKEEMKKMVELNNNTSDNLSSLTELLNNAKLPEILTKMDVF